MCKLDWDGAPVFKTNGIISDKLLRRSITEIMCGCKNEEDMSYDGMRKIYDDNMSSGKTAKYYVDMLFNLEIPDLTIDKSENKYSREYKNIVADHICSLSATPGKPTLLIDEIDNSFDFENDWDRLLMAITFANNAVEWTDIKPSWVGLQSDQTYTSKRDCENRSSLH